MSDSNRLPSTRNRGLAARFASTRATTLVELIVSSTLLLLVLGGAYAAAEMSTRASYVQANDMVLEQSMLVAMSRVSQEVVECDLMSWAVYTSPPGIVFASPRDSNGVCQFDATNGNVTWQAWVCFYVDTVNGTSALIRKSQTLSGAPLSSPPAVDPTFNTLYFKNLNSPRSIVAFNVTNLSTTALPLSGSVDILLTATRAAGVPVRTKNAVVDNIQAQTRCLLRN